MKKFVFKKYFIFLFCLLILSGFIQNGYTQIRAGGAFLKILPGARQQGFAYNTTAFIDEPLSYFSNPAALGFSREWYWSLGYTKWFAGIYNVSFNTAKKVSTIWSKRNYFALGINYLGVPEFNNTSNESASASAGDLLVNVGIGSPMSFLSENLSIGVNFKYLQSKLFTYTANSSMLDIGLLLKSPRIRLINTSTGLFRYGILTVGASLNNIGQPLKFIKEKTPLPRSFRTGVAIYAGSHHGLQVQISTDYRAIKDEAKTFGFGMEISWRRWLSFRGGYNLNDNYLSKYSLGVSLGLDDIQSPFNTLIIGKNKTLDIDLVTLENNEFFQDIYRGTMGYKPNGPERFKLIKPNNLEYSTSDTIRLIWEKSKDPDLYDNIYFGYIVVQDSISLAEFITKSESREISFLLGVTPHIAFNPNLSEENIKKYQKYLTIMLNPLPAGHYYWAVWAYDKDDHVRFAENKGIKIYHFRVIER